MTADDHCVTCGLDGKVGFGIVFSLEFEIFKKAEYFFFWPVSDVS